METINSHPQEPATNVGKSDVWKRGLIMLVFMFLFGVGQKHLVSDRSDPIPLAIVCK